MRVDPIQVQSKTKSGRTNIWSLYTRAEYPDDATVSIEPSPFTLSVSMSEIKHKGQQIVNGFTTFTVTDGPNLGKKFRVVDHVFDPNARPQTVTCYAVPVAM